MKHIQKRKKERVPDKSLDLICTERKKERKKERKLFNDKSKRNYASHACTRKSLATSNCYNFIISFHANNYLCLQAIKLIRNEIIFLKRFSKTHICIYVVAMSKSLRGVSNSRHEVIICWHCLMYI